MEQQNRFSGCLWTKHLNHVHPTYGLITKSCQPESKSQSRELMALIWKGLGRRVVVRLSLTCALTSLAGVSDNAPSLSTRQLAIAPTALSAIAVGERVET